MRRKVFLFWMLLATGAAIGQAMQTQADMHARVLALYNFSPNSLDNAGRAAKSDQMDKFWEAVKADPSHTLPLLRMELLTTSNPPFFMEDGSELLTSLSKEPRDMQIAADAHALCDLVDVQPASYFYWVHEASMQGIDTTKAALHILDDPTFVVPVPQHAMTLDQSMSLVYMLVPVDSGRWLDAAKARFKAEKNEAARSALLDLFFYAQTNATDNAIDAAARDPNLPDSVRKKALKLQQDAKDIVATKFQVKGTEASIREERMKRMAAVSDEAIDDVQHMTGELMILRSKP